MLRHEEITELEDLFDLERALWGVDVPEPDIRVDLPLEVLTGGIETYPACQEEARRLRASGHRSLRAPSASLVSGFAERYQVVEGSQSTYDLVPAETFVFFGEPVDLVGMPLAEGHAEPPVFYDVRPR